MTLDELLEHSRTLIAANKRAYVEPEALRVAEAIVNMLGEAQPCMVEPPQVINGLILLDDEELRPDELRAICAVYLRCADRAEAQTK